MIVRSATNDVFFKYVLAIICFVIGLVFYGFSNSVFLKKPIYTLQESLQLKGNKTSVSGFSVPINIKKYTRYLIESKISGYPTVNIDFFGAGYDSPKQEIYIPGGNKEDFKVLAILNSDSPPPPSHTQFI